MVDSIRRLAASRAGGQRPHRVHGKFPLVLVVLAGLAVARPTVIPGQSEVGYVATQMGVPVEGNFARFDARIDLDPAKPEASSVSVSVDTSSLDFPAPDVLKELTKSDWFDTAHYPTAQFQSRRIRSLGEGRFEIAGALTIKGHTRDVVVPVSLTRSGSTSFAAGSVTIRRLDYDVGVGDWRDTSVVEDDVRIRFRIAVNGLAPG
jgi:polyisoprenoid-binding protein YceI